MSWSSWRCSSRLKPAITSKVGGVEPLHAAGQPADRQVAREHAAGRAEQVDRIEKPRADLGHGPVDAEDAFQPEQLEPDIGAGGDGGERRPPGGAASVADIDRPTHHRQDEVDLGEGGGHGGELGQLGREQLELADQAAAAQPGEAATPVGVGQQVGPGSVAQQRVGRVPGQMLADGPDPAQGGPQVEPVRQIGALEVDRGDQRVRVAAGSTEPAEPAQLCRGVIGDELGSDRGHHIQAGDITRIVLGQVHPGQGGIVPDQGLEAGAALRENRIGQAAGVDEVLVAVEDRECFVRHHCLSLRRLW